MNILYNIRHKGRITIQAIVVFFLVAFSSYTYNKSISEMGDISSEMYSDRLIAQDYIYQLGKILYERKLIMASQTATNTADTFKYDSTGILTLLNNYEKTKLTKNEKIQFQEFRKNVLLLLSFEQKQLLNSNKGLNSNILALQSNAVNVSLVQLDKLAEIQIATGKQLNDDSTKIVSFSSLLNQFDWAIIIVIGLIIQVIIFTTKSAIPKKAQNQFLN